MEKLQKSFDSFINLMDKNNHGVQIACYSVALLGLTVSLRKVRPFSRFRRPSDIPNHFINEKRELIGYVKRIDPNKALLIINHKPLVKLPLISTGNLPVKISGVEINNLGTNWLQSVVVDKEVTFIPIYKEKDFVQCQVLLTQDAKDKKHQVINIGERLVKIGFAVPEHIKAPLLEDPSFRKYHSLLLRAEKQALRKQLGYKYYIITTKKLINYTNELLIRFYKQSKNNIPKLIAIGPKIYHS